MALHTKRSKGEEEDPEYHKTDLIWFDCDLKDLAEDRKAEGERLKHLPPDELKAYVASVYTRFMDKCRALGMEPRRAVYSGHGFQGTFDAPRLLEHDETEAANRAVARRFKEFGADDAVTNIGRILRPPHSYNVKNPERPIKTELWHLSDARLTEETVAELIEEGRATTSTGKAEREQKPTERDNGNIDWYCNRTNLRQWLFFTGKYTGDATSERFSSVYSTGGNDCVYGTNGKGHECISLKSSSHPAYQYQKEQGIDNPSMDAVDALVFHEYVEKQGMSWDEARKAALQSIAGERDMELAEEQLRQAEAQAAEKLLDVSEIPEPLQRKGDKLDFTDEQAVKIIGLPSHLAAPDDDMAFGQRFAEWVQGNVHSVAGQGWMAHDEDAHVWVKGDEALMLAERYAKQLAQVLSDEVNRLLNYAIALNKADRDQARSAMLRLVDRMTIAKGKKGIGSRTARLRAIEDAKELLAVRAERFEAKPFVLGFPNGVYDNGTFREHCREDYLTELLPVEYDPHADQSDWLSVLERMTGGDKAFQSDLQYAVGYGLSGRSNQRLIYSLVGPRGTGKSLFTETMLAAVGGLGATVPPEMLAVGSKRGALGAVLYNKRIVVLPEVGGTRRLESEIVKTISSGGDSIPVEFKYKQPFTARPTHAAFMVSNEAPNLDNTDEALWERIQSLPFTHRLARDGQEDLLGGKHLQDVMRDPQSPYLRGFLAWAMEGLERVRRGELFKASATVVSATAAHREEADPFREFWLEWGIEQFEGGVYSSHLQGMLKTWCAENGGIPMPKARRLKAVCEAVGLVRDESVKKWMLVHPERFPQ